MRAEGAETLAREGVPAASQAFERTLDLRYRGQAHTLGVPLDDGPLDAASLAAARARFDAAHERSYGHAAPDEPVELLNLRLVARGARPTLPLPSGQRRSRRRNRHPRDSPRRAGRRGLDALCHLRARGAAPRRSPDGPAVVEEAASTLVLYAGDRLRVADGGHLIVEVGTP